MLETLIVPTLHNYIGLQAMLASIDYPIAHLVVIDNGGACPDLRSNLIGQISVLRMPSNLGVAASWNLGIKLTAMSPRWLIASDDIVWAEGALARLACVDQPTLVQDRRCLAPFAGFLLGETVVASVGLFDEFFYPGVGEDLDYRRRITDKGIAIVHLANLFDHPHPSKTVRSFETPFIFQRNATIARERRSPGWNLEHLRSSMRYLNAGPETQATRE